MQASPSTLAAPTTTPIIQIRQIQPITIDNGGSAEISGASSQAVTFEGATGTLKLDDAPAFTGHISGLTGADAIDLADVGYGANTRATFSGNANGGTLTVTNGTQTANIALLGNYLTSGWTLSGDGHGGTVVVDPTSTFPNATNTGVPGVTALSAVTPVRTNTTTNGTVISGYQFTSHADDQCQQRDDRELLFPDQTAQPSTFQTLETLPRRSTAQRHDPQLPAVA